MRRRFLEGHNRWFCGLLILSCLVAWTVLGPLSWQLRGTKSEAKALSQKLAVRHGFLVASLGDLSALMARLLFLKAYHLWERYDTVETELFIRLASMLDAENARMWMDASQLIAYDIPVWELKKAYGTVTRAPQKVAEEIYKTQGQKAWTLLEEGAAFKPKNWEIRKTMGEIADKKLRDVHKMKSAYKAALDLGAPWSTARVYLILLKPHFPQEAWKEAQRLYPLCRNYDKKGLIGWIEQLEKELEIPENERFKAPDSH